MRNVLGPLGGPTERGGLTQIRMRSRRPQGRRTAKLSPLSQPPRKSQRRGVARRSKQDLAVPGGMRTAKLSPLRWMQREDDKISVTRTRKIMRRRRRRNKDRISYGSKAGRGARGVRDDCYKAREEDDGEARWRDADPARGSLSARGGFILPKFERNIVDDPLPSRRGLAMLVK